jgi:hypothetical protein
MRRFVALLSAVVLVASLASASLAAGPTERVNRFAGNFDMLDEQTGNYVGRIVVSFTEPTPQKLVPGTLDVYWAPYNPSDPPFPYFMDLSLPGLPLPPVKESHAQLLSAWFDEYDDATWGHVVSAGADGYLCDYAAPWNSGCRYFSVIFQTTTLGPARVANWSPGDGADPDRFVLVVGKGAFALTYAGPTGS